MEKINFSDVINTRMRMQEREAERNAIVGALDTLGVSINLKGNVVILLEINVTDDEILINNSRVMRGVDEYGY